MHTSKRIRCTQKKARTANIVVVAANRYHSIHRTIMLSIGKCERVGYNRHIYIQ